MHFARIAALTLLMLSSAYATTVRVITVGGSNGALTFFPNNTQADPGDVVQFQFKPGNNSVAEAAFSAPCMPINQTQPSATGWWSGFMPMPANTKTTPVFSVMVQNNNPIYFYNAQSNYCQRGMVGAVNAPSTGPMSVGAFASAAQNAAQNMAPGQSSSTSSTSAGSLGSPSTMSTSTTAGGASTTFPTQTPFPTGNGAGRTLAGAAKQSIIGAGIAGLAAFLFL